MNNYGFVKVAAASPRLRVADPEYNLAQILELVNKAEAKSTAVIVFPELSVTGYTCADLFNQQLLLNESMRYLTGFLDQTRATAVLAIVGMPVLVDQKLYNCAVVTHRGRVLGVVPKMYLPNYKEYYEKRWFSPGYSISQNVSEIRWLNQSVPFGNLIFRSEEFGFSLGVELCEDLWVPIPPSSYLALNGAAVIANPSASNDLVSKSNYRQQLVLQQSARCLSGYIYASAGVHESTTDNVFGGECLIAENGNMLKTSLRFNRDSTMVYAEFDVQHLDSERQQNKSFADSSDAVSGDLKFRTVELDYGKSYSVSSENFDRFVPRHPFVPENPVVRDERCEEIFHIQVAGLAKRLEYTRMDKAVIGISGGLDSTLALLVTARTFEVLGIPHQNIMAVTMPGFGTSNLTHTNALQLMKSMKVSVKEVDIRQACRQHFQDVDHDPNTLDATYENIQARERTQILMDIANRVRGLVIGTGDLSELALGWCTYNGDHMSMYAINSGIPKTLVKFLVQWAADNVAEEETKKVLRSVLDTPISPELLPPDASGCINQKTEDAIGPYELHDFFLYYVVRQGAPPQKVLFLACQAFHDRYEPAEVKKWLRVFYQRFFSQQFKRSCMPDGPKVGSINLSPRGDWRMPSDAEVRLWLRELE